MPSPEPPTSQSRVAATQVADHFDRFAAGYAEHVAPCFEATYRYLEDHVTATGARRIADVACGDGRLAAALARVGGREVVALERSEALLAVARERPEGVEWLAGDAADLPLPSDAFDLAICNLALPLFSEPGRALGELARIAAPGGEVIVSWLAPAGPRGADGSDTPLSRLIAATGFAVGERRTLASTIVVSHPDALFGIWAGEVGGGSGRAPGPKQRRLAEEALARAGGTLSLQLGFELFHLAVAAGESTNGRQA